MYNMYAAYMPHPEFSTPPPRLFFVMFEQTGPGLGVCVGMYSFYDDRAWYRTGSEI